MSLQTLSGAGMAVLTAIQSSEAIRDGLATSHGEWQRTAIIHGDLRLDNIMFLPPNDFRLIDWELWGTGDPAWDLGTLFEALTRLWLHTAHTDDESGEPIADDSSWAVYQAALRSLWFGYTGARETSVDIPTDKLARYAAVRMIQTAFESTVGVSELQPMIVTLLQICENVFTDSAMASEEFFAINSDDFVAR
jgi:hypothetical protein